MRDDFAEILSQTRQWIDAAAVAGFADERCRARFVDVEERRPADLFVSRENRPLVVAFFGGTGVGKSSLLNRLVGRPVARTGVVRPTSVEVTLFAHRSVELAALPPQLRSDALRVERHDQDARRSVVWIDSPDVDSTREENREIALSWLPHVDLVVYVISPERYRDDAGWRILAERRGKHGWLFVMNRSDEGNARQRDDFAAALAAAGFERPLVFATCCRPGSRADDEFAGVEAAINDLLYRHGLEQLERLGVCARFTELRAAIEPVLEQLGDASRWEAATVELDRIHRRLKAAVREGLEYPIRLCCARIAARETAAPSQLARITYILTHRGADHETSRESQVADHDDADTSAKRASGARGHDSHQNRATRLDDVAYFVYTLWDDWADSKLRAALDAAELAFRRLNLPAVTVRTRLDQASSDAGACVRAAIQDQFRAALAHPGSNLTRLLRRVTGFLIGLLPCLALAVVAYQVVNGYYRAMTGMSSFLDVSFAVHSALLIFVAWAIPFAADRSLRPSIELALRRAAADAISLALDELGARWTAACRTSLSDASGVRDRGEELLARIDRFLRDAAHADRDAIAAIAPAATRVPAPRLREAI